jgi:hypothetical protein
LDANTVGNFFMNQRRRNTAEDPANSSETTELSPTIKSILKLAQQQQQEFICLDHVKSECDLLEFGDYQQHSSTQQFHDTYFPSNDDDPNCQHAVQS